jgi:hypothetical protein
MTEQGTFVPSHRANRRPLLAGSCRLTAFLLFLQPHPGAAAILRNEFDACALESNTHAVDRRWSEFLAVLKSSHSIRRNFRQLGEFDDPETQSCAGHSALDGRHS